MKSVVSFGIFSRSFAILTLVGLLIFSVSGAAAAFKDIKVGDKALPINLVDMEGHDHSLSKYGESKALPELEKAANADSGWVLPQRYLGYVHFRTGDIEKAYDSLDKASDFRTRGLGDRLAPRISSHC